MNFNPGLYFDGSNDFLSGSGGYSSGTQIVVFKSPALITTATTATTLIGANVTGNDSDVSGLKLGSFTGLIASETVGVLRGTAAAGFTSVSKNAFSFLGNLVTGRSNNNSPSTGWFATINGTSGGTITSAGTGYQEWAGFPYLLGASSNIAGTTWSNYYNGHILEVISYPTKLNNTEYIN